MHTPDPPNPKPQIINDVRELLRRGEWDAGVLLAVQQMEAWILQGPPGFWERHSGGWLEEGGCMGVGGIEGLSPRYLHRQRSYAQA